MKSSLEIRRHSEIVAFCPNEIFAREMEALWNLFWLALLIVVIYLVVRKIRNEAKVKNGRAQLAGKVRSTDSGRLELLYSSTCIDVM